MKYLVLCFSAQAGPDTPTCYYGLNGYPVSSPKREGL